jgi:flagellar motor switch protein FliG
VVSERKQARRQSIARASGRKRAAALLIALGPEVSAQILRQMPEEDVGQITWEIVGIGQLSPQEREEILSTFYSTALGRDFVSIGGVDYAQTMLEKAFGKQRAAEFVGQLERTSRTTPFAFLRQVDTKDLVNFLRTEHPQVAALILAYLPADQASGILQGLPEELQAEVAVRLAMMERTSPDVIREVEDAMRSRLGSVFAPRQQELSMAAGGIDAVVEVLRKVDLATEKTILDGLENTAPETANEIRKRMFVFENITLLDDRSIQRVLREVDSKDLGIALKGATDEVKVRIVANMSERAGKMLEDDMAALGPVRLRHVEEAQGRIVAVIRRLEEAEEIFVMRAGEADLVV